MPIQVACPRCGFAGQVPDHAEGRTIKCKKCGTGFPVVRQQPQSNGCSPDATAENAADPFAFAPSGAEQTPDQTSEMPDGEYTRHKQRSQWMQGLVMLVGLGFVAVAGLAFGAYFLFTGNGPLAGEPETLKEVVERLEARGMKLTWEEGQTNMWGRSIIIYGPTPPKRPVKSDDDDVGDFFMFQPNTPRATIRQYVSAREAKEAAGSQDKAFSKGRFVVTSGFDEFLAEIKSKL